MQRHESYKPSGIQWVSEIPENWDVQRAKWLFDRKERPPRPEDGVVTAFRDGQVTLRTNRRTEGFTNAIQEHGYQGIRKGDLVIHAMDAFAGAIGVSESDGKSTPVYAACVPRNQYPANSYYYAYMLRYMAHSGYIESLSKGIRERSTDFRFAEFRELPIPIPPQDEQDRIVEFLDHKTAEIDATIAKKVRLIELLKEQQNILIGRAATQGLGLGTDALPENRFESSPTPSHWKKLKLKYCVDLLPGFAFKSTAYTNDETDIPLLRGVNINPGQLNWRETVYWPRSKIEESSIYFLSAGDLVIGMDRPWVADGIRVAAISSENLPCLLLQRVARLRAKAGVTQGYLELILTSKSFLSYFEPMLTGISVPHISHDQIGNFEARLPPLDEQEAICGHVSNIKKKYKMAIAHESKILESLIELKSTLVSEVVTGKIKV